MAYELENFCADCNAALKADSGPDGRARVRENLERLLASDVFIAANFDSKAEPGKRTLYHDPETDMFVLAHINAHKNTPGTPHDHGESWAVYGQAGIYTDMTEWRRVDDANVDGHAELEAARTYRLDKGMVKAYGPNVIHSTYHPDGAWLIRVTGTDLDQIQRYRYDPEAQTITKLEPVEATP